MKIEIEFHLSIEELPERSGKYLCAISTLDEKHISYFTELDFSKKHKMLQIMVDKSRIG